MMAPPCAALRAATSGHQRRQRCRLPLLQVAARAAECMAGARITSYNDMGTCV